MCECVFVQAYLYEVMSIGTRSRLIHKTIAKVGMGTVANLHGT